MFPFGPLQKSWTASLETKGRNWALRYWAVHPLGWQAQVPSGPWHRQLVSPSLCTQCTQLQGPCLARTPCRTYWVVMHPPAMGRPTHTFLPAWPLLDTRSHCFHSQMGILSCRPSRPPPRTHLCLPTHHPATVPRCWLSLPQPGPCMTLYCRMETLVLTWTPSIPLSPTLTSRVSWEAVKEGWWMGMKRCSWPCGLASSCLQAATCWLRSFWSDEADEEEVLKLPVHSPPFRNGLNYPCPHLPPPGTLNMSQMVIKTLISDKAGKG